MGKLESRGWAGFIVFFPFLLVTQALKDPAPYADQLESLEDRPYQRVSMEEALKGTPRESPLTPKCLVDGTSSVTKTRLVWNESLELCFLDSLNHIL